MAVCYYEAVYAEKYHDLSEPGRSGVLRVPEFIGGLLLEAVQTELSDPSRVAWRDNHSTFVNKRGLTIVQNHDVYALRLTAGDDTKLKRLPAVAAAAHSVRRFVRRLGQSFPVLANWQPDELSLHRYDDAEVGLSFHKDNLRFTGAIAILSLEGDCDLAVRSVQGNVTAYPAEPGDLFLLRAPGLIDSDDDLRPEHAVLNLRTPTRISMMLRQNRRAAERLPGFEFDNW